MNYYTALGKIHTSIPTRGFYHDALASYERAVFLGFLDHPYGDTILDGSPGIEELNFGNCIAKSISIINRIRRITDVDCTSSSPGMLYGQDG